MVKGWTNPKYFLLSAVCAALAHLTRQDGVLLVPTLIIVVLFARLQVKTKVAYVFLGLGLYLVILSPLLVENYKTFGSALPPGPSKTMFLTNYEDLYSYSRDLNLQTYLQWGIRNILSSKLHMALSNAKTLYGFFGELPGIFILLGLVDFLTTPDKRGKWSLYLPPALFIGFLFAFYSFVATFPSSAGGFERSSMAIIPFGVVIAVDAINHNITSRKIVALLILLLSLLFLYQSVQSVRGTINGNINLGEQLAAVKAVIKTDGGEQGQRDVVIMTRNPWEVYYSTGYKAIQIPNEDINTIYGVAQKFGANYLLLPAPRKALENLYAGKDSNYRFEFLTGIPNSDLKVFRIKVDK